VNHTRTAREMAELLRVYLGDLEAAAAGPGLETALPPAMEFLDAAG